MFELQEYRVAHSLEEAHALLVQDRKHVILGGTLWMRLGRSRFHTGIDLSCLGLDRIEDLGDSVAIGCMTSLRQVETSRLLQDLFGSLFADAMAPIVGVQFRNIATVGGSVFSRFGFSDLITALMVLDTRVHLYQGGTLGLEDFLKRPQERDILVRISIPKKPVKASYQSFRRTATDFPVLTAAVSHSSGDWRIALGARPGRAAQAVKAASLLPLVPEPEQIQAAGSLAAEELSFGTDDRGGTDFRKQLAAVLVKRGIGALCR